MDGKRITAVLLVFIWFLRPSIADTPASARAFSVYSSDRTLRADTKPGNKFGSKGKTTVYDLKNGKKRLYRFDWYAHNLLLEGTPSGVALVRFGPWPSGIKASEEVFAFSIYSGKKLVKSYSTLDIAESPDNVLSSVSHHIYSRGREIRHNGERNRLELCIQRIDGVVLSFDLGTGELVSKREKFAGLRQTEWFHENFRWINEIPAPAATNQVGPSHTIEPYRAIWAGTISSGFKTSTNWTVRLTGQVQMEPRPGPILLISAGGTNSLPLPREGEVWAFSGSANGPFLFVKDGKRFPEYESKVSSGRKEIRIEDKPKRD